VARAVHEEAAQPAGVLGALDEAEFSESHS